MASQRRVLIPLLILALAAWTTYHAAFVAGGVPAPGIATRGAYKLGLKPSTSLQARGGGDDEGEDSVELGGFSGFVVGLALLPHVLYACTVAFGVVVGGQGFALGPYGLELVSCSVTAGLTLWSLGSFVQRGKGLPAGPLGFLGLAEGLSYLAVLGLAVASASTAFRSGGPSLSLPSLPSAPTMPAFESSMLKNSAPQLKSFDMPKIDVPKFEAPKIDMPKFEAPKMPEIKAPKIEVPKIEVPKVEVPKIEVPKPAPPAPKPEPKKEEPKPEPKKEEPKPAPAPAPKKEEKKAASGPDYDMLFD
jgi:hypothetical protein